MTKLIHRYGDIFTTTSRAIGHGVNTVGVMGAGIAAQFSKRFPEMFEAYREACSNRTLEPGGVFSWSLKTPWGQPALVLNIASQELPGANASYDLLIGGVAAALQKCDEVGIETLALPRIGSGIGGLDQRMVEVVLTEVALRYRADIELWTYNA
jgi:O-acetyl-ADP-ribose deacetylase (regulator of RNase III)